MADVDLTTELANGMALKTEGPIEMEGRELSLHANHIKMTGSGPATLILHPKLTELNSGKELDLRADHVVINATTITIQGTVMLPDLKDLKEERDDLVTDRVVVGPDGTLYRAD